MFRKEKYESLEIEEIMEEDPDSEEDILPPINLDSDAESDD